MDLMNRMGGGTSFLYLEHMYKHCLFLIPACTLGIPAGGEKHATCHLPALLLHLTLKHALHTFTPPCPPHWPPPCCMHLLYCLSFPHPATTHTPYMYINISFTHTHTPCILLPPLHHTPVVVQHSCSIILCMPSLWHTLYFTVVLVLACLPPFNIMPAQFYKSFMSLWA